MNAVCLFPQIYSLKDFYNRNHPENIHPDSYLYDKYWSEEDKKVIEGIWGLDSDGINGGYRYMPPSLYFYINYCIIEDESDANAADTRPPDLRDWDWITHYDYLAARGFSGWENAPFTCHRSVYKLQNQIPLSKREENIIETLKHVKDKNGRYKPYKHWEEALHDTYSEPLGIPVYENTALNYMQVGSRGSGKEQPHYSKIMTPTGYTTMGNIKVGDNVIAKDGTPTKVINKFPQGKKDIYRIHLLDGRHVDCGLDHLWEVYKGKELKVVTTKEIIEDKDSILLYKIKNVSPILYSPKKFKVHPYNFGISIAKEKSPVFNTEYLYGDYNQRLVLLQGILDNIGNINNGSAWIPNKNKELIEYVITICQGLGIYYNLSSNMLILDTDLPIFSDYIKVNQLIRKTDNKVQIIHIEKLPYQYECSCIEVDHSSHTYLTDNFVVTHNTFGVAGIVTHMWITHGQTKYNPEKKPGKVEIMAGGPDQDKSVGLMSKVKSNLGEILLTHGSYTERGDNNQEVFYPGYFHQIYTGNPTNPNDKIVATFKIKKGNTYVDKGIQTTLTHTIFTSEKPEKAASKRTILLVIEECGLIKNLLDVVAAAKNATIRKTKFGTIYLIGTSGNLDKIDGTKEIFLKPELYQMLSFDDKFEGRTKPMCRFLPAYYADSSFKDELGNTRIQDCLDALLEDRITLAKSDTSDALDKEMMNRPIIPSEMFLTKTGNMLPVSRLRERLTRLEIDKPHEKIWSVGMLHYTNKERTEVRWTEDTTARPLLHYKSEDKNLNNKGAIIIYEHPPDILPEPTYSRSLYKITCDPVKDDHGGTSLYSVIVYKGFAGKWEGGLRDTIVAEWIGRLDKVNDMHEIVFKLCFYYNCKVMPEINISDIVRYAEVTHRRYLLQPTPYIAIGKVIQNPSFKYDVGIDMTSKRLQIQSMHLLKQWLLTENKIDPDTGVVIEDNIDNLYSIRGIEEMIQSGREGNYDHLRSFMILALWLSQEDDEEIKIEDSRDVLKELERYFIKKKIKNYGAIPTW